MNIDKAGKQRRKADWNNRATFQNKFGKTSKNVKYWNKENNFRKRVKFQVLRKSVCYKVLSVANAYRVLILKKETDGRETLSFNSNACQFCTDLCLCVKMKDKEFESFIYDNLQGVQNKNCYMHYMRKTPLNRNPCETDKLPEMMGSAYKLHKEREPFDKAVSENPQSAQKVSMTSNKINGSLCNSLGIVSTDCSLTAKESVLSISPSVPSEKTKILPSEAECDYIETSKLKEIVNTFEGNWFTYLTNDKTFLLKCINSKSRIIDSSSTQKSASILSRRYSDIPVRAGKSVPVVSRRNSDRPLHKGNLTVASQHSEIAMNCLADNNTVSNTQQCITGHSSTSEKSVKHRGDKLSNTPRPKAAKIACSDSHCSHLGCQVLRTTAQKVATEKLAEAKKDQVKLQGTKSPLIKCEILQQHIKTVLNLVPHSSNISCEKNKLQNLSMNCQTTKSQQKSVPPTSDVSCEENYEKVSFNCQSIKKEQKSVSPTSDVSCEENYKKVTSNSHIKSQDVSDPRLENALKRKAKDAIISMKRVKYDDVLFPPPYRSSGEVTAISPRDASIQEIITKKSNDPRTLFKGLQTSPVTNKASDLHIEEIKTIYPRDVSIQVINSKEISPKVSPVKNTVTDPLLKYRELISSNPSTYSLKKRSSSLKSAQTSCDVPRPIKDRSSSDMSVKTSVNDSLKLQTKDANISSVITSSSKIGSPSSMLSIKTNVQVIPEILEQQTFNSTSDQTVPTSICISPKMSSELKNSTSTSSRSDKPVNTNVDVSPETSSKLISSNSTSKQTGKPVKSNVDVSPEMSSELKNSCIVTVKQTGKRIKTNVDVSPETSSKLKSSNSTLKQTGKPVKTNVNVSPEMSSELKSSTSTSKQTGKPFKTNVDVLPETSSKLKSSNSTSKQIGKPVKSNVDVSPQMSSELKSSTSTSKLTGKPVKRNVDVSPEMSSELKSSCIVTVKQTGKRIKTNVDVSPETSSKLKNSNSTSKQTGTPFKTNVDVLLETSSKLKSSNSTSKQIGKPVKTNVDASPEMSSELKSSNSTSKRTGKPVKTNFDVSPEMPSKHRGSSLTSNIMDKKSVTISSKVSLKQKSTNKSKDQLFNSIDRISSDMHKKRKLMLSTPSAVDEFAQANASVTVAEPLKSHLMVPVISQVASVPVSSDKEQQRTNDHLLSPKINDSKEIVPKKKPRRHETTSIEDYGSCIPIDDVNSLRSKKTSVLLSCDTSKEIQQATTCDAVQPGETQNTGPRNLTLTKKDANKSDSVKTSSISQASYKLFSNRSCANVSKLFKGFRPVPKLSEKTVKSSSVGNDSTFAKSQLKLHYKYHQRRLQKKYSKLLASAHQRQVKCIKKYTKSSCVKPRRINMVSLFDFKVEHFMEKVLQVQQKPHRNIKSSTIWLNFLQMPIKLSSKLNFEFCLNLICSESQMCTVPSSAMVLFHNFLQNPLSVHLMKHSNSGLKGMLKHFAARALKMFYSKTKKKKLKKKLFLNAQNNSVDNNVVENCSSNEDKEIFQMDLANIDVSCKNDCVDSSFEVIDSEKNVSFSSICSKKYLEWDKCSNFYSEYFKKDPITLLIKEGVTSQILYGNNFVTNDESFVQKTNDFIYQNQFLYNNCLSTSLLRVSDNKLFNLNCQDFYFNLANDKNFSSTRLLKFLALAFLCNGEKKLNLFKTPEFSTFCVQPNKLPLDNRSFDFSMLASADKFLTACQEQSHDLRLNLHSKVSMLGATCTICDKGYKPTLIGLLTSQTFISENDFKCLFQIHNSTCVMTENIYENRMIKCSKTKSFCSGVPLLNQNSDCALTIETNSTSKKESNIKDKVLENQLNLIPFSKLIDTAVTFPASEEQSTKDSDTAEDMFPQEAEINVQENVVCITSNNTITLETSCLNEVENPNCMMPSLQFPECLNPTDLQNELTLNNTGEIGDTAPENSSEDKIRQREAFQELFASIENLSECYQEENSDNSRDTTSRNKIITKDVVPSPIEECSLLLDKLWDGFEAPVETSPAQSFQFPWPETTSEAATCMTNISPIETLSPDGIAKVSEKSLPASQRLKTLAKPHTKFLHQQVSARTVKHKSCEKETRYPFSNNKVSAQQWPVPPQVSITPNIAQVQNTSLPCSSVMLQVQGNTIPSSYFPNDNFVNFTPVSYNVPLTTTVMQNNYTPQYPSLMLSGVQTQTLPSYPSNMVTANFSPTSYIMPFTSNIVQEGSASLQCSPIAPPLNMQNNALPTHSSDPVRPNVYKKPNIQKSSTSLQGSSMAPTKSVHNNPLSTDSSDPVPPNFHKKSNIAQNRPPVVPSISVQKKHLSTDSPDSVPPNSYKKPNFAQNRPFFDPSMSLQDIRNIYLPRRRKKRLSTDSSDPLPYKKPNMQKNSTSLQGSNMAPSINGQNKPLSAYSFDPVPSNVYVKPNNLQKKSASNSSLALPEVPKGISPSHSNNHVSATLWPPFIEQNSTSGLLPHDILSNKIQKQNVDKHSKIVEKFNPESLREVPKETPFFPRLSENSDMRTPAVHKEAPLNRLNKIQPISTCEPFPTTCPPFPGLEYGPFTSSNTKPEMSSFMDSSDVFQAHCRIDNKKHKVSIPLFYSAFHDFNLFGEGKPMHRYYKHLQGTGSLDLPLNPNCMSKDLSELNIEMLESYLFLNEQVEYHKSLLRGLVSNASDPQKAFCEMEHLECIAKQLEYIQGYELACSALLM